jgi:hypothetical protein
MKGRRISRKSIFDFFANSSKIVRTSIEDRIIYIVKSLSELANESK